MGRQIATREADELILKVMHLREVDGLINARIAERLGMSKGTVAGIVYRFENTDIGPCQCVKRCNQDGGMRPGWWRRRG